MKILVLGGAGDMGREAVRDLVLHDDVEKVVIGDHRLAIARDFYQTLLGKDRAEVLYVDADQPRTLPAIIAAHDLVLNCLGPFSRYERPVAEAALAAGRPAVSLCDDHDAASGVRELDAAFRARDLPFVTGMGCTPGLSNLLIRKAATILDRMERVRVTWAVGTDDSEGRTILSHFFDAFTGTAASFQRGRPTRLPAGSGGERVRFSPPLAEVQVCHLRHPSPLPDPEKFPGLQEISVKGGLLPGWLHALARRSARLGFTGTPEKCARLSRFVHAFSPAFRKGGAGVSGLRVDIHGFQRDGRPVQIAWSCTDRLRRLTGIPAAVGTLLLGRGKYSSRGVLTPEQAFDPELFLAALQQRQIRVERVG